MNLTLLPSQSVNSL